MCHDADGPDAQDHVIRVGGAYGSRCNEEILRCNSLQEPGRVATVGFGDLAPRRRFRHRQIILKQSPWRTPVPAPAQLVVQEPADQFRVVFPGRDLGPGDFGAPGRKFGGKVVRDFADQPVHARNVKNQRIGHSGAKQVRVRPGAGRVEAPGLQAFNGSVGPCFIVGIVGFHRIVVAVFAV